MEKLIVNNCDKGSERKEKVMENWVCVFKFSGQGKPLSNSDTNEK